MDWILRQARVSDEMPLQDIGLKDGQIVALASQLVASANEEWDLAGRVVLPGMVDIHTHLDKTYSTVYNKSGTLLEAIQVWQAYENKRTLANLQFAVEKAIVSALKNGVTAMRSHLNLSHAANLEMLELMLSIRDGVKDKLDLQLVALGHPEDLSVYQTMVTEALAMGVDYIGGAPALTSNPREAVAATFAVAEKTGKPIDLHVDETEDPHMLTLEDIAEQTLAQSMQGQVTAGHCCSLAFADEARAAHVMDKVAEAQVHIITLPSCNLVLMGRGMQPVPRGVTRVKELLARGVIVCAASDNVCDPFNPFGAYDLLQIANLTAHVAHLTGETELYTCLDMVTTYPAQVFGRMGSGLVEGAIADLVVVEAQRKLDAMLHPPERLATFKAGKLIVRTNTERTWYL